MKDEAFPLAVVESIYEQPLFAEDQVERMFRSIGEPPDGAEKVAATTSRLNELAKSFAFDLWHERQASGSARERRARRLAGALLEVLSLTGQGENPPTKQTIPGSIGPGALYAFANIRGETSGEDFVVRTLQSIYLLRQDALHLADMERRRRVNKPPRPGAKRQKALANLIAGLSDLYFSVWETVPAISRAKASNTPSGKLVSLFIAVTSSLQERGLVFGATAESLAKHWERLPPDQKFRFDMDKTRAPRA